MLLSRKEMLELANPSLHVDVHQSRLLDSGNINYDDKVILKKKNFHKKPGIDFVVISTNEDRDPIYRFRFPGADLEKLFEIGKPKRSNGNGNYFINIFIKDGNPKLYIPGSDPQSISKYLY